VKGHNIVCVYNTVKSKTKCRV